MCLKQVGFWHKVLLFFTFGVMCEGGIFNDTYLHPQDELETGRILAHDIYIFFLCAVCTYVGG